MVCGLVALVIAACCTLDSGAQVQLPTVQSPLKDIGRMAITPDGRRVLFSATDIKGVSGTWLKDLRTGAVTRFGVSDGTDFNDARFSPDGEWLVLSSWRHSALRRVSVAGGPSTKICDVSSIVAMDWGDDDRIVFAHHPRNPHEAELRRVPASGGPPEFIVTFKSDEHVIDIHVLPGSRAALVTLTNYRNTWIVVQPLGGGASSVVVSSGSHARYVSSKKVLVYRMTRSRDGPLAPLAAAPFDPVALRLTGPSTRLAVDVAVTFAISSTGILAHVVRPIELVRAFRDGNRRSLGKLPEDTGTPRVSRDGRRLAYASNGLWVADLARLDSSARRLTLDTSDYWPVWSPDGLRVAFAREVREPRTESTDRFMSPARGIYSIAVDGGSPAERLALHGDYPTFWSPVTGRIGYERSIIDWSLWTTAPGEGTSRLVFRSSDPLRAALSRDGKWLAFEWRRGNSLNFDSSNYVYVSPFRSGGMPTEIPVGDAYSPVWSHSSDELFFEKSGRLLVTRVGISAAGVPTFSEPLTLYDSGRTGSGYNGSLEYDVMPDGGSVLVKVPASPEIVVVPDVSSRRIQ
jgi:hypothetical protein